MKEKIKYDALKHFLQNLKAEDFKNKNKIIPATLRHDADRFKIDAKLSELVEYGQPFLVDLIGNDLSVCILTKRKYKTSTGRLVNCKLDRTIIFDCRSAYDTAINGCWKIPKEFLE